MADDKPPAYANDRDLDGGQHQADEDPITRALEDAVQARRHGGSDAEVLDALRQAAAYCCTRLQETLDQAFAEAELAQQRFAIAIAGDDAAEKARRYAEGQAAMLHAQTVALQAEQALLDLADGITELTGPALLRLQRAAEATQRLLDAARAPT